MQMYSSVQHIFIDADYALNLPSQSLSDVAQLHSETSRYISELMKFKANVERMITSIQSAREEVLKQVLQAIDPSITKLQTCIKEINHYIHVLESHASKPDPKGYNIMKELKEVGLQAAVTYCPLDVSIDLMPVKQALESMVQISYRPVEITPAEPLPAPKPEVVQVVEVPEGPEMKICDFCKEPREADFIYTKKQCRCVMCCFCLSTQLSDGNEVCPRCNELLTELKYEVCITCAQSFEASETVMLPCRHQYCRYCIQSCILSQMYEVRPSISCTCCGGGINPEIYEKIVSPEEVNNYEKALQPSYQPQLFQKCNCMSCEREFSKEKLVALGCFHYYCKNCLSRYLSYRVENKLFSSKGIECLNCEAVIDINILKEIIGRRELENYTKVLSNKRNQETKCPMCYRKVIAQTSFMQCGHCNYKFCVKCCSAFHIGDCPAESEVKFIESFSALLFKIGHCPACRTIQAKRKGTKDRVACRNPECGIVFCIQCSKNFEPILAHGPHYHGSRCEHYSTYRRADEWTPSNCINCKTEGKLCKRAVS
jgi:hypothetical protein